MARRALVPITVTMLTACWHATVETGLTPSTVVIDRSWASSWIEQRAAVLVYFKRQT